MKIQVPEKFLPEPFDAKDTRYRFRLWVRLENADETFGYHFYWRRIALACLVALVIAWLAGAGAILAFLRYRHGFEGLSYLNIVNPARWSEHRRSLGRLYIERARTRLAKNEPAEALLDYKFGLARVPDDLLARRELAIMLLRFGNPPAALAVLEDHIAGAVDDLEYLKLACSLMFELQEDARIAALCRAALPATPDERLSHQFLALNLARVHFRAGNFDAAETILTNWRLERSVEGLLLRSACDWERGYPALALQRIEIGRDRFPTRDEIPLQRLSYLLELGRHREALSEAILRISTDPESPGPRIDLLHSLHAVGETDRYNKEKERFFRDFPTNIRALELLADSAASYPDIALVEAAIFAISAAQADPSRARLSLVVARIESDQFAPALQLGDELQNKFPLESPLGARLAGWRAVAARGVGDLTLAGLLVDAYAAAPRLTGSDATLIAKNLERLGSPNLARKIYASLLQRAPKNQAALTQLVRLDALAGNSAGLEEFLPRLLDTAKPSAELLQEAYVRLDDASPARFTLRRRIEEFLKTNGAK